MRVGIYASVSTIDQNCELQLAVLREYIRRHGWENAGEYVDAGWSGTKASRPELNRLMGDASQRKFDVILCWRLYCKNDPSGPNPTNVLYRWLSFWIESFSDELNLSNYIPFGNHLT